MTILSFTKSKIDRYNCTMGNVLVLALNSDYYKIVLLSHVNYVKREYGEHNNLILNFEW